MKKIGAIVLSLSLFLIYSNQSAGQVQKIINDAEAQTRLMLKEIPLAKAAISDPKKRPSSPRTLDKEGKLAMVASKDWTSGFFPGELWYLYEFTGNKEWLDQAKAFTTSQEPEKLNAGSHDVGFKIYCSFGNGYRLTNDPHYREVVIEAAHTLSKRFKPATGCIRSWDHNQDKWGCPVIIDNMMNLELLFAATRLSGDSSFYKIAVSHANTTLKNHFRPDFSCYHVVDYDTITGKVVKKNTHQGFSHESAWARGQAWALYGFTMCYRETRDPKYLHQAEMIAGFLLNHPRLPADLIPYWDFDAPGIPNEPRDASAAAVIASALYELSVYSSNRKIYLEKAGILLHSLTNSYRAKPGDAHGFILLHSTGSKPMNSEVDVPLCYADYYYLEALLRSNKLKK
jgi:rhamnogalacturonyl hydrolase YesR